ncbi:MAG TPA: thioredoxin family protein [Mycobacteriales bacterium]|nr:thioredoxin family protein [Mycobacteriales bacterium]
MTGVWVLLATLAVAGVGGGIWRRRRGRMVTAADRAAVSAEEIGTRLGERATLLQFSSAFCAPCRATRQVLAEVAGMLDGVAHVEVDAESHLDLVRRLDIRSTPTTLVLDRAGLVRQRAAGQPRKADVIAALDTALT